MLRDLLERTARAGLSRAAVFTGAEQAAVALRFDTAIHWSRRPRQRGFDLKAGSRARVFLAPWLTLTPLPLSCSSAVWATICESCCCTFGRPTSRDYWREKRFYPLEGIEATAPRSLFHIAVSMCGKSVMMAAL